MSIADIKTTRTDSRHRAVLPGPANQLYAVQENPDGSILLSPATVVTEAQLAYDRDPQLQAVLAQALASPTVYRKRRNRV
jgi:hypothetical protein